MEQNKTVLERSFELARSGEFTTVETIRRRLSQEGYMTEQLKGRELNKQLQVLMRAAKARQ